MKKVKNNTVSGGIYGLAFIGALVYYIQNAATVWAGVLGFFKALFLAGSANLQGIGVS